MGSTGKRKVLVLCSKERLEPNRDNELLLIILISIWIEILTYYTLDLGYQEHDQVMLSFHTTVDKAAKKDP